MEKIDELVDGLPSFTDWSLATAMGMNEFTPGESFGMARIAIPRLNRVRRLLGQIPEDRKHDYQGLFIKKIDDSMDGYVESRQKMFAELNKSNGNQTINEPSIYDIKRNTAGPLIYILTEWDCLDALPTFAHILEQPDPIPVNRLFLLYSSHILIRSVPIDKLSPNQKETLNEYHKLALKCFPEVERVKVPAWNAKYDETDFRAVILHQQVPFQGSPYIRLRLYPDLSRLEDINTSKLSENAKLVLRSLLRFSRIYLLMK